MKFQGINKNFKDAKVDIYAVSVFTGENAKSGILNELDKVSGGLVAETLADPGFESSVGSVTLVRYKGGRILLTGAGDKDSYTLPNVAKAAGTAARAVRANKCTSFAFASRFEGNDSGATASTVQGVITSQFELGKYQTVEEKQVDIKTVVVFCENAKPADLRNGIARGEALGDSMNFARDLANEPPNILTPTEIANRAKKMAKEVGLKCEVLDEAQMKKLGMNSILSVSLGSTQPAKLIVLTYTPTKSTAKKGEMTAFVGKGVMFDTGGISLKSPAGMEAMKYDMSGAATVIGTMRAIALLKPSVPVMGVCGCVENMPDGNASRPSDVVTAMNGKTIEILNTDAEGRLVLADAVAYAEKRGATTIVDMATLTGAVVVALGSYNTGVLGNNQELVDAIIESGKETGEGFWQLPLGKDYSKMIKSDIADVANISRKSGAGTIIGGAFIEEFIDKAKWGHLDIAGTAWDDGGKPYQSKGPTGVAIRTLVNLVEKSQ
ncbi:MAG: leucyl aminopeptidase [Pyrinomonadaceae bacterium]